MDEYSMAEVKQIIRSIAISGNSKYLTAQEIARDFKKMEGYELPYRRLGFHSVDQFLHTLSDTVKVKGYGSTALVEPVVTQSNRHILELVQNSKNKGRKRPKQRYTSYGNNNGNGYSNNTGNGYSNNNYRINEEYPNSAAIINNQNSNGSRKTTNIEYDFLDTTLSNGNGSDSSDSMPKFTMTEEKKLEQVVNSSEDRKNIPQRSRHDDAIPDDAGLILINSLEVPKEAMNVGDIVDNSTFPETVVPKQSIRMFVTEVHNPNRFWFHIGDNTEKIDDLMNEIEVFYSQLDREEWRIKPANVVVGLYCMAKYIGLWHRAKIVGDYSHNKVKVFYIDYGTVTELELKDVKFMAKCFAQLPAQAMRASLAYVKPVSHRWTRDASWSMLSLVYEKLLYAYIVDVDRKDNVIDVVLIDTNGAQDIIINQHLFVKGHATWEDDMPYKDKTIERYRDRSKTYCELFPRFDELECGIYPSFREIGKFRAEGFNFTRYYVQSLRNDSEYLTHIQTKTFTIPSDTLTANDMAIDMEFVVYPEEESQISFDEDIQNECRIHSSEDMSMECKDLDEIVPHNPFDIQQQNVSRAETTQEQVEVSKLANMKNMLMESSNVVNEIISNNPFLEQNVFRTIRKQVRFLELDK